MEEGNSFELTNINEDLCCICLNTYNYNWITLKCCGQKIHDECLMDWLIIDTNINYKCPICRKSIQLDEIITLGTFIDYINNKNIVVTKKKVESLISKLYNETTIGTILIEINEIREYNQDNLIDVYSNRFRILLICTLLISIVLVIFIYYSFIVSRN